jgi:hypothetical protein
MSKTTRTAVAAGLALLAVTCEKVPLTAPAGTSIFLQCNPPFVVANGGTSLVTALLTEPAGTLVPDGTTVLFFTTLGRIDAQGVSVNGVVRVHFVADSRSGTATITAYAGGPPAPAPSGTPTPSSDASFTASAHVGDSAAAGNIARDPTNSGTGSASITIDVGGAIPASMVLVANPQRITSPRQSTIVATVYDAFGNPIQNIPVTFQIVPDASTPFEETLDSGGSPRYTDSNGQAFDTLRTRAPVGGIQKFVEVAAIAPNISSVAAVAVAID